MLKIPFNTILAGIAISIGAYSYLAVGGIVGAVLFSVGLMSVLQYRLILYTGCICRASGLAETLFLALILLGNIIGCAIASTWCSQSTALIEQCGTIVSNRAEMGFLQCSVLGIGCGWIMSLAVTSWNKTPWPLLIGIPAFILSGFTHSVADAFYYCVAWKSIDAAAVYAYLGTVIGNFIGGIAYKAGDWRSSKIFRK